MGSSKKTDGFFKRNRSVFVLGLSALIIAAFADLFAGFFLTTMEDYLKTIAGMMILVYCAIGMRGNIFGAMGSRLGTAMHLGTFSMTFKKRSILRSNIEAAMTLTLLLSLMMGVVGWIVTTLFFGESNPVEFIFISLVGGLLSGMIVVVFNIIIAYIGYKREWDVDNITAPLIAAVGDIVTVPMIFVAVVIEKNIGETTTLIVCIILSVLTIIFVIAISMRKNLRKRADEAKRIVKQSFPVLLICMFFEIAAGAIIQSATDMLIGYSALLILLPAFLNEGNALSGMLTSRLSSMLHLGTLEPKALPRKNAFENFGIMYVLATLTFLIIGAAAYGVTVLSSTNDLDIGMIIAIVMIAGLLTTTVLNFISYYVAIAATKFNLDPDDHSIPVTSSIMDVIGTGIIVAVIGIAI